MARAQQDAGLRTGPTIDAYERLYFGLFPDIPIFDSARVALEQDSSLTFIITRRSEADTTVRITPAQATQLRTVLDAYEHTGLRDVDARPKGEAATRASLVRENIMLPRTPLADDDTHILVTVPATAMDPDAAPHDMLALRLIGRHDSMVIALPRLTDSTGRVHYGAPAAIPIRELHAFRHAHTSPFATGFYPTWAISSAAMTAVFLSLPFSSNTGTHDDYLPHNPVYAMLYVGMLAAPIGIIGGIVARIASGNRDDPRETDPALQQQQLERRMACTSSLTSTVPPELRTVAWRDQPDDELQPVRMAFDDRRSLRSGDRSRGVLGWRIGVDIGIPLYYLEQRTAGTSAAVQLMYSIPLDAAAAEPAWIIRPAIGIGTTTWPQIDLALIHAPGRRVWYQIFTSWEATDDDLGDNYPRCGNELSQRNFRDHLFSGIGLGFRLSASTGLDLTTRMSWGSIIRTKCPPVNRIDSRSIPDKSLVILRATLSFGL
jgi:hypothetical protein